MVNETGDIFVSVSNGIIEQNSNSVNIGFVIMYITNSRSELTVYADNVIFPNYGSQADQNFALLLSGHIETLANKADAIYKFR